jgi:hypothetical protein
MWWLLACVTAAPDPWAELGALPLETFHPLLSVDTEAGGRLLRVEESMLSLYTVANGIRVLDPLYHGSATPLCLDASPFDADIQGREGACGPGYVQLQRGFLSSGHHFTGVDVEGDTIWMLDETGALFRTNANPQLGNPFDYLRPLPAGQLARVGWLQVEDGLPRVANADGLWEPGADSPLPHEGEVTDFLLVEGRSYVLTSQGLWRDGERLPVRGKRLTAAVGGVLGVDPALGELWRATPEGVEVLWTGTGLTGPVAQDPGTKKIYVPTENGLQILDGEGIPLEVVATKDPIDIYVAANHEILLLFERKLEVYIDQEALQGPPPLQVWTLAFLERPRKEEDDVPCFGRESVASFLELAASQAPMLRDLALPTALGLTPQVAARVRECGQRGRLQDLTDDSRTEVGMLYHDVPEDCTGSCYPDYLTTEAEKLRSLGLEPAWISGMAPQGDQGLDWATGTEAAGLPTTFLFGGMSLLTEVDHDGDPRAKDSWPWRATELSPTRRFRSAAGLSEDADGPFTFLPGNNIPLFSLKGCPNLFLRECQVSLQGSGQNITAEDLILLNLLLHRALAARGEGPATWYFHLPDLGQYDYIDGCTEENRRWSGCEASLLQEWSFDVQRRFVLNHLVETSLPSRLP